MKYQYKRGFTTFVIVLLIVLGTGVIWEGYSLYKKQQPQTTVDISKCLPADIKLDDIVSAGGYPGEIKKVTVKQKLNELKATCSNENKLVDATGKQITFYHLTGCWGNAPIGYQEILQKQQEEINKLKEQYTVIEMTCNPSGIPIP